MTDDQRKVFSELLAIAQHAWRVMDSKKQPGDFVAHEQLRRERLVLNRAEFELELDAATNAP